MGENGNDLALGYVMGQDSGGGGSNGGGGDWFGGAGIWGLLILALLFGWGGFGGGGFGGGFGGGGGNGALTRAAVAEGFQYNNLENGIRGIQQGLCDGFYAMNTGLLTGFNGVQMQMANMAAQNASCCCETQRLIERGFCDVGYALATNTTNIIQSQHGDADRVIAKLDQMEATRQAEKIEALRNENLALRFQASQLDQNAAIRASIDAATAEIIRRTGNECPIPAYVVPNPNCCYGNPVGVSYGAGWSGAGWSGQGGSGCGCGCG